MSDDEMNTESNGNGHHESVEEQKCAIWPTVSYLLERSHEHSRHLDGIGTKVTDLQNRVANNRLIIDGLTQQMGAITSNFKNLQDQIAAANSEVIALRSDLKGHFTRQTITMKELESALLSRSTKNVSNWEDSTTSWFRMQWWFAAAVGGLGGGGLVAFFYNLIQHGM